MGLASPPQRETLATAKERLNFLVEVQAKVYYGLKTMARKFRKYGQVESIRQYITLITRRKMME